MGSRRPRPTCSRSLSCRACGQGGGDRGPQSATVGDCASLALRVETADANGNPVGGVAVRLAAPSSGPSATFPGGKLTADLTTGADGTAAAPALTANSAAGSYKVLTASHGLPRRAC